MNPYLDQLEPSASMQVMALGKKLAREGHKVFPLSVGDTHFAPPISIQNGLVEGLQKGFTHYQDARGLPELREMIASHYYPEYSPDEILVAPGVKQAMYYFFMAGNFKKVAVLEPAWLGYKAIAVLTGKEYISINYRDPDWMQKLQETEFDLLLGGTPNNPDGKIFTGEELDAIERAVEKNNAELALDEIYKPYDYDGKGGDTRFNGKEYATLFNGFSKSHAMTGLRIGYMAMKNADRMKTCIKLQQNIATCANTMTMYAAISAPQGDGEVREFAKYYHENRELVKAIIPELAPFCPDGAFYYFIDLSTFGIADGTQFCQNLMQEKHIGLVPGLAFGKDFGSWARLSYCVDRDLLTEALQILKTSLIK